MQGGAVEQPHEADGPRRWLAPPQRPRSEVARPLRLRARGVGSRGPQLMRVLNGRCLLSGGACFLDPCVLTRFRNPIVPVSTVRDLVLFWLKRWLIKTARPNQPAWL